MIELLLDAIKCAVKVVFMIWVLFIGTLSIMYSLSGFLEVVK